MKHSLIKILLAILIITSFAGVGCRKSGIVPDHIVPVPLPGASTTNTRLINFAYDADLTINGRLLTNRLCSESYAGSDSYILPPTPYFLTDGIWRRSPGMFGVLPSGNPLAIPDSLVRGDSAVVLYEQQMRTAGINPYAYRELLTNTVQLKNGAAQDVIYYLGNTACAGCNGFDQGFGPANSSKDVPKPFGVKTAVFARGILQPVDPQKFKIRIINLGNISAGSNLTDKGEVTLCYQDGAPVAAATKDINMGEASDYVELPLGTYYFRVKNTQEQIIPEKWYAPPSDLANDLGLMPKPNLFTYAYGNLPGVSTTAKGVTSFGLIFNRSKTYLPGGIYTIVVSPKVFTPVNGYSRYYQNGFELVTDNKPAPNFSYGRVQVLNALPGKPMLQYSIDGNAVKNAGYGIDPGPENYQVMQAGSHMLTVKDSEGKPVFDTLFVLKGQDNLSIWLYENEPARITALIASNDLSYTRIPYASVEYQTGNYQDGFGTTIKVLNLSADVPAIAFTRNPVNSSTQAFASVAYNDVTGNNHVFFKGKTIGDYAGMLPGNSSSLVFLNFYQVAPDHSIKDPILPANLLLTANASVLGCDSSLLKYMPVGRYYVEHGVYTMAIIGRKQAASPEAEKLRMMIIRHIR